MHTSEIVHFHERFCQDSLLIRNVSRRTIKWYRDALGLFLKFHEGRVSQLHHITSERLREYLYQKRRDGWKASTFRSQYNGIKSFLKWCVKNGHLETNPIETIDKPRLEKLLPRSITRQEAERLLEFAFFDPKASDFARRRNRAILGVLIYTGLRAGELTNLRLRHIDLDNGTLFVSRGKGAKDRILTIVPPLDRWLHEYLIARQKMGKKESHFFTALSIDSKLTPSGLKKLIARLKDETSIEVSPHKLRHTFATQLLAGGCGLYVLRDLMGHASVKTTERYLSASPELMRAEAAKHPMSGEAKHFSPIAEIRE